MRLIHVVECINCSFLLCVCVNIILSYSINYLFIYQMVDFFSDFFHHKSTSYALSCTSLCVNVCFHFSHRRVGWKDHVAGICLTLKICLTLFLFYFPSCGYESTNSFTLSLKLGMDTLFNFSCLDLVI